MNVRPGSEEGAVARECSLRMSWRRGVASHASGSSAREIGTAGRGPAVPASIQTRSLGTRRTPRLPLGRAPQSTLPIAGPVLAPLLRRFVAGSRPRYRDRTDPAREQDEA